MRHSLIALLSGFAATFALDAGANIAVKGASESDVQRSAFAPGIAVITDSRGRDLQEHLIWMSSDERQNPHFVAFRKSFHLGAVPGKTQLHIFADARYLIWINGRLLLRGPARFDPHGPEYDSLDLTGALHAGDNQIAVVVMANGSNARMMRHLPGLTLKIEADGQPLAQTDNSWKCSDLTRYREPRITWANLMDRIDARVEDGDWTQPDYNDQGWPAAVNLDGSSWGPLSARRIPLLRDSPVAARLNHDQQLPVTLLAGQHLTLEMDRLIQAYTTIELEAEEGTELSLDYAGINYIARAGRQTYVSSDTIAFARGTITVKTGRATIHQLQLIERLYPFDCVGRFQSSDPLLDRLWGVCIRSGQILSEDAYVDCADRERAEWMDCDPPAFDITRTAFAGPGPEGRPLHADPRLLAEMLRRTALSLQPEGWVKAHTTSDRFDIHALMEDRSCDWVQGARRYYESTGSKTIIREIWPAIVAQMNYFLERRTPRGLVLAREWVTWGNPIGYSVCEGAGLNAFVYKALVDAAYLGNVLGEKQRAAAFSTAAVKLAQAFNNVLWDEKQGTYASGFAENYAKAINGRKINVPFRDNLFAPTMFSGLFALDQGIVPESRRARVQAYVLAHRDEAERTGHIMPLYFLFRLMYEADDATLDSEILATIRRLWQPQAESDWGTTWESLNGAEKAHCYGQIPGYFLSAYVLGVRPLMPALTQRRLLIEPRLGGLTQAAGVVETEYGPVPVSWKYTSGRLDFRIEVPPGVNATVHLPTTGKTPACVLDGVACSGEVTGRYVSLALKSGKHIGSLTLPPTAARNAPPKPGER